jgi:Rod binding domain-containing protein
MTMTITQLPPAATVDIGAVANAASRLNAPGAVLHADNATRLAAARNKRLYGQAQDFEVQFLNSMFQQMYAGLEGDGPFGNSQGVGPWRSFLTEEYAKGMVRQGGIGITDTIYKSLLAAQEVRAK